MNFKDTGRRTDPEAAARAVESGELLNHEKSHRNLPMAFFVILCLNSDTRSECYASTLSTVLMMRAATL